MSNERSRHIGMLIGLAVGTAVAGAVGYWVFDLEPALYINVFSIAVTLRALWLILLPEDGGERSE